MTDVLTAHRGVLHNFDVANLEQQGWQQCYNSIAYMSREPKSSRQTASQTMPLPYLLVHNAA